MEHEQIAARLRLALEHEAARHELSAGAWPQLQGRLGRQAWRRRGIAAACLAIAVAAATAAALLLPSSSSPPVSHPHHRPAPQLVIVSRTHLGRPISKVAAGYGGVWIVGPGLIYRVDPATGRKVATISVPGTNEITSGICTGVGSVWVTSGGDHRGIYRIDPRRNRVTSFIRLPLVPTSIAVAYGRAWATVPRQGPGIVERIDPHTNRVSGSPIHVGASPGGVVALAGGLWITSGSGYSTLTRINPATGAVTRSVPNIVNIYAAGAGSLWVTRVRGGILRLDPATGKVTATIPLPHAVDVTFWAGSAWASNDQAGTIVRIDPASNQVIGKPVRAGTTPIYIASSPSGLWVVNADTGSLLHLARPGAK